MPSHHKKALFLVTAVVWFAIFIWVRKQFPKSLGGKEAPEVLIFVALSAIAVVLALPKVL